MATAQKQQISENQYRYLTNMSKGITPTGGKANPGQIKWAKAQLARSVYTTPKPAPTTPPIQATTTTPNTTKTPTVSTPNVPTTQPMVNTMTPPVANQQFTPPSQPPSWDTRMQELFNRFEQLVNTPFTYNPETDPRYQAQRQLAQQRAQEASRQAMEAMNERGMLSSSLTATQLGQIQQQAEQEALSYIPQYEALARQDYQNRLRAAADLLRSAMDIGDQQFGQAVTEANLTGTYLPPEARGLINNLLDLKRQAEAPGITREARAALSQQADAIRSQLQGMGVDPSLFGANVNAATAQQNIARAGIPTLEARGQQFQQDVTMAELTGRLPDGTPTTAEQQRQLQNLWQIADLTGVIPNQLADMYGIPRGTPTQDAKRFAIQASLEGRGLNLRERELELAEKREDRLSQPQQMTAEDVRTYLDTMVQRDPETNQITNTTQLEEQILLSGLPEYEMYRLYRRYGIPWEGPIPTQ